MDMPKRKVTDLRTECFEVGGRKTASFTHEIFRPGMQQKDMCPVRFQAGRNFARFMGSRRAVITGANETNSVQIHPRAALLRVFPLRQQRTRRIEWCPQ